MDNKIIHNLLVSKSVKEYSMKTLVLSIALLSSSFIVNANQYYPNYSNGFTTPNFNWGNGTNGSNWSMPNMNWGNGNNYNSGSNWNMPNFNWGSNNRGSNWGMPSMNWGNNNGYGSGSNWSMPSMNWGNGYNGANNWNMPSMNWGNNGNNNIRPWNFGNGANTPAYKFVPNPAYQAQMPQFRAKSLTPPNNRVQKLVAPQAPKAPLASLPKVVKPVSPSVNTDNTEAVVKSIKEQTTSEQAKTAHTLDTIPKPSGIKDMIVAPGNKSTISPETAVPSK